MMAFVSSIFGSFLASKAYIHFCLLKFVSIKYKYFSACEFLKLQYLIPNPLSRGSNFFFTSYRTVLSRWFNKHRFWCFLQNMWHAHFLNNSRISVFAWANMKSSEKSTALLKENYICTYEFWIFIFNKCFFSSTFHGITEWIQYYEVKILNYFAVLFCKNT